MTRILWVEGSPRGDLSLSSACARAFLDEVRSQRPDVAIEAFDVWDQQLPEFAGDAASAKFAPIFGEERTPVQAEIWEEVEAHISHLESFDAVVVSAPMWNWSIPYRLKHWIDIVAQPFRSFTLSPDGRHVGVIGVGKPAQFLLTRSSAYDGRSPEMSDHQQPYLEYLFAGMLGYTLSDTLVIEPTTRMTAEEREIVRREALSAARTAGKGFAAALTFSR